MREWFVKLHIAVFLAGFTGVFGKIIHLDEFVLVWYRILITTICLLICLGIFKKLKKLSGKGLWKAFLVGAVIAVHWVFFYGGIIKSNISVGVVCFSSVGFFTAILEPLIMHRKFSVTEFLLSILVVLGVFLIFSFDPQYRLGIILGTIAAFLGALYGVLNKKWGDVCAPTSLFFYEMLGGSMTLTLLLPLYILLFPETNMVPTGHDWASLVLLASVCTVIPFVFQIQVLKKISAFTVNLTFNLEPIYSILIAFIFFNEAQEVNFSFYTGIAIILLSVFLQTYLQSRKKNV